MYNKSLDELKAMQNEADRDRYSAESLIATLKNCEKLLIDASAQVQDSELYGLSCSILSVCGQVNHRIAGYKSAIEKSECVINDINQELMRREELSTKNRLTNAINKLADKLGIKK